MGWHWSALKCARDSRSSWRIILELNVNRLDPDKTLRNILYFIGLGTARCLGFMSCLQGCSRTPTCLASSIHQAMLFLCTCILCYDLRRKSLERRSFAHLCLCLCCKSQTNWNLQLIHLHSHRVQYVSSCSFSKVCVKHVGFIFLEQKGVHSYIDNKHLFQTLCIFMLGHWHVDR